jgi:hypothetical protein
MAKKRKKSKSGFYIWTVLGLLIGIAAGFYLDNLVLGLGIFIAFTGFAWIVSGMGMK